MITTKFNALENIAPYFWRGFNHLYPYEVETGGRGSTKTTKLISKCIFSKNGILVRQNITYVFMRKYSNKIKRSIFNETKKVISRIGLNVHDKSLFATYSSPPSITYKPTNSTILFSGVDNVDDIKGLTEDDDSKQIIGCLFDEMTEIGKTLEEIDDIVNSIYATLARGTDEFSFMGAFNPPKRKLAPINEWVAKKRLNKDFKTSKTNIYMLPPEYIKNWKLTVMLQEAERLKAIDYDLWAHVYMAEEITPQSATYPNFKREKVCKAGVEFPYWKIVVGVDTGQSTSANSFTAVGIGAGYHILQPFKEFYHHNKTMGFLDSQARVEKFFSWTFEIYQKHGMIITAYIESADAQFYQDLLLQQKLYGHGHVVIKKVNKKKRLEKSTDALEERIEMFIKLFGSNRINIINCPHLVDAFETSERDKNGKRLDDGVAKVDPLDSVEYATLDFLKEIDMHVLALGVREED